MNRKSNPTVIIVNTGLATEKSKSAMIEMLQDKVAHIHQDPDLDWKSALGYHDIEKSGVDADFIREDTEVILLQDNVVLHSNCKEILQQPIPEKGSAKPFMIEPSDKFWPEVSVVDNVMGILGSLSAEGLLGLVGAFVLYHIIKK